MCGCKSAMGFAFLLLVLNLGLLGQATDDPCPDFVSVDITDGVRRDHTIIKDNVTYTPANYFSHQGKIRGCICNIKPCLRKCCPKGHIINDNGCERADYEHSFQIHLLTEAITLPDDHFHYIYNNQCITNQSYMLSSSNVDDMHYLQANGSVHWLVGNLMFQIHQYCLETFDDGSSNYTDIALICFEREEEIDEAFYIGKNTGKI